MNIYLHGVQNVQYMRPWLSSTVRVIIGSNGRRPARKDADRRGYGKVNKIYARIYNSQYNFPMLHSLGISGAGSLRQAIFTPTLRTCSIQPRLHRRHEAPSPCSGRQTSRLYSPSPTVSRWCSIRHTRTCHRRSGLLCDYTRRLSTRVCLATTETFSLTACPAGSVRGSGRMEAPFGPSDGPTCRCRPPGVQTRIRWILTRRLDT
jgi:hypothetical protein